MNENRIKAFVTGGTGFIGSHLVEELAMAGYDIKVLVRESSDLSFLPAEKINLCRGDVRNYESLKNSMRDCSIVFHAAAFASDWGKKSDFYEINVKGTKNVLRAAKENNIDNVVLISTTGVLGEENCAVSKTEESSYNPKTPYFLSRLFESDMNYYRHSKMLAEKEAIKFSKENGLNLTVIRPVWVYGPREFHAGPFEFCKSLTDGCRILPMGRNNKFHVVYVKDLAKAIISAIQKEFIGIRIFNIGNPEVPTAMEYFDLFRKHLGVGLPIYIPFAISYSLGIMLEVIAKLLRAKTPYLLTRARAKMVYCNNIYDVSRSKEILGFRAETSLDEGIRETVNWWKENGYLKAKGAAEELNQEYITGLKRSFLDFRMGITIFAKYFIFLCQGKINLKQYLIFVRRILLLSKVLSYNKAVRIDNVYKMHLYLPSFPSKAFYKAMDKFLAVGEETFPTTVLLSMTKACGYHCTHCYQKNDGGEDLPEDTLIKVAQQIQNVGVSMFDIEGGEPLLKFDRLLKLVQSLDDKNEIWVNTTGHTLSYEKALKLKRANVFGVMVSIHHWLPEKHDEFVGKKGAFAIAVSAIKTFQRAGISTAINSCPSLEVIQDDGIEKMMEVAKNLNCSFVQFIHEKPAGAWFKRGNALMEKVLLNNLCKKHIAFNKEGRLKDYPSLSMQVFEESTPMAFGCTAGGIERFYVNASGEVQPCEFLNVSFGNVREEGFVEIYKRMRKQFKKPTKNWLCNKGCDAMAKYVMENNITAFPLKKEIAAQFIAQFDHSEEVPLYKKMKLCEKV